RAGCSGSSPGPSGRGGASAGPAATGSRKRAGRATRRRTPPSSERDVLEALGARERELVDFARNLVATPSPNPPGDERQVAELSRSEMAKLGYSAIRTVAMEPTRPNVVGDVVGKRMGHILMFNGHIDTKPTGDVSQWATGPYDPVVREGRLHGLGSADMKGAVAAMVYAGAALAEVGAPAGTLRVVLTADEENGSLFGARFLAGQ